jgi:death-on-curing protein
VSEPVWLPYELILDLHAEQLREHGGAPGLRDENGLRSALARPRQIATYESGASLFRLAAAYAYGLTRNHPFVDGNKRAAFIAAGVFLGLNDWYLDAPEGEATGMVLALAAKDIDEAAFTAWLKRWSVPP